MRKSIQVLAVSLITATISVGTVSAQDTNYIRDQIILESVSSYLQNVGNCPCYYNFDAIGNKCGERSANDRLNGYDPICYRSEVSGDMIKEWEAENS